MSVPADSLVTSLAEKLPTEYQPLVNPSQPLPPHVQFFEKQFRSADIMTLLVLSLILFTLGLPLTFYGLLNIWSDYRSPGGINRYSAYPLGAGVIMVACVFILAGSLRRQWAALKQQKAGKSARFGILLTPDALLEVNPIDYCVIPGNRFLRLSDRQIQYKMGSEVKSVRLPETLMSGEVSAMVAAIEQWKAATGSSKSDGEAGHEESQPSPTL